VIVAVHGEPATGHEADSLPIIIERSKWLRHNVGRLEGLSGCHRRGRSMLMPPQHR
jgi:hypothetical protein